MHVIAAKAVALLEASRPDFVAYQKAVIANAQAMARVLVQRGYRIVSGGTDNHLFLLDLVARGITGKDAEARLGAAGITVNKNAVPNDPQSPFVTSGVRIGTPAATTRGFGVQDCTALAGWICDLLDDMGSDAVLARVARDVAALCAKHPVYGPGAGRVAARAPELQPA
jgi:glycine hydroxymethyltransferase